jgi:hypothetical protein
MCRKLCHVVIFDIFKLISSYEMCGYLCDTPRHKNTVFLILGKQRRLTKAEGRKVSSGHRILRSIVMYCILHWRAQDTEEYCSVSYNGAHIEGSCDDREEYWPLREGKQQDDLENCILISFVTFTFQKIILGH